MKTSESDRDRGLLAASIVRKKARRVEREVVLIRRWGIGRGG